MKYSVIHNDQITFIEDKSLGRLVDDMAMDDLQTTKIAVVSDGGMVGGNNTFYINSEGKLIVPETKVNEPVLMAEPVLMNFIKRKVDEPVTQEIRNNELIRTLTSPQVKSSLTPSDSPPVKPEEKTDKPKTNTRKKGGWIILGSAIVLASALAIEHFSESKAVEGLTGLFWKSKKSKAKPKKKSKKSKTKKKSKN